MKDIISVNIATDLNHTYECDTNILGREGEGNTTQLELTIPKELSGCTVYLDFEKPNGETLRTAKLTVKDGVATYDVSQYILEDDGEIKVQAVFVTEGGQVWKSSIKTYFSTKSINAVDDIPEKEDFITEAQKVLDELSGEVAEIAELLSNDADFVEVVKNGIEEATSVKTITGSRLKFFVGTKKDYEALKDKENLFAIITDDTAKTEIESDIKKLQDGLEETNNTVAELGELLVGHSHNPYLVVEEATISNGATSFTAKLKDGAYLFIYNNGSYYSGVGYIMPSDFDNEVINHYISVGVFGLHLKGTVNEEDEEKTDYTVTLRYIKYFPDQLDEAEANYSGSGKLSIYRLGVIEEG